LWQSTQPLTLFVIPLLAGALGWLQVNGELRRDQWAFLVHRPATRGTIFWGKALAGLGLYALAAVLPYVGFALWMRAPGHVPAPFDWRLVWPGIATLSLGVVFYFAGMLTRIRAKPWLGSRALALPACVVGMLAMLSAEHWWSVLLVALVYAIAMLAARGSFQTTGRFKGQSRWVQVALSSTLLAGLLVVTVLSVSLALGAWTIIFPQPVKTRTTRSYQVTEKGRVLVSEMTYGPTDAVQNSIRDLNGRVLLRNSDSREFYKRNRVLNTVYLPVRETTAPSPITNAFDRYFAWRSSFYYDPTEVLWYFDRVRGHLVGYSLQTRDVAGYIGANGFQGDVSQVQPFEETLVPTQPEEMGESFLHFPHSIYWIDTETRRVRPLFTSSRRIIGVKQVGGYDRNFLPKKNCIAVWTDDNVLHMLSPQGQELWMRPLKISREGYTQVQLAQTSSADRFWIWMQSFSKNRVQPQTLIEVDARGQTLKQQTLPLFPAEENVSNGAQNAFLMALPPAFSATYMALGARSGQSLTQILDGLTIGHSPEARQTSAVCLMSGLLASALCAVLSWRRASRYAFKSSTRLWWTTGVLALGPLGYLLMRSLLDWPALEKCSSCGKLRVVDRELCEHCNSPFAPPLLDGTEIIENAVPEMPALRLAS